MGGLLMWRHWRELAGAYDIVLTQYAFFRLSTLFTINIYRCISHTGNKQSRSMTVFESFKCANICRTDDLWPRLVLSWAFKDQLLYSNGQTSAHWIKNIDTVSSPWSTTKVRYWHQIHPTLCSKIEPFVLDLDHSATELENNPLLVRILSIHRLKIWVEQVVQSDIEFEPIQEKGEREL